MHESQESKLLIRETYSTGRMKMILVTVTNNEKAIRTVEWYQVWSKTVKKHS